MIVTKTTKTIYKVEMTEAQRRNLMLLLETGVGGHVNELNIQQTYGTEVADDVRETCNCLLESLESA